MRVLVVEDEAKMATLLKRGLEHEGYAVDLAGDGAEALWAAREFDFDAIVLDAMIPEPDGFEVCRTLRSEGRWTPVLLLTARDAVDDRVLGLDAGADDYLTKPFAFSELFARLRALTRRDLGARPTVLEVGDLVLDPATRQVRRGEADVALSAKQFAILEQFMRRPGEVLSRGRPARARVGLRLRRHVQPRRRLRAHPAGAHRPALRSRQHRDHPGRRLPAAGVALTRSFVPASLRGRLALLFTVGSVVILILSGGLIYLDLNGELRRTINTSLLVRARDIEADVKAGTDRDPSGGGLRPDPRPRWRRRRLLGTGTRRPVPAEVAEATSRDVFHDRRISRAPALGRRARLLAHPVQADGRRLVVVVGASLDAVIRGRERLALILGLLSPLLGALLSAGGWLLAGAALRPVRRMSQEADAFSLAQVGRRLAEPPGEDEIAQLGRTLNAMLDRIEAAFARERMFLDDASHELRTPIAVLRAELEMALLEPGDREATERSLRSALEEADRLAHLAEDLLILARAGAGRLPLRRRPIDVRTLAEGVARRADGPPGRRSGDASAGWAVRKGRRANGVRGRRRWSWTSTAQRPWPSSTPPAWSRWSRTS